MQHDHNNLNHTNFIELMILKTKMESAHSTLPNFLLPFATIYDLGNLYNRRNMVEIFNI